MFSHTTCFHRFLCTEPHWIFNLLRNHRSSFHVRFVICSPGIKYLPFILFRTNLRPIVSDRLLSKLIENIHRTNGDQDREMSSYIRIPMIDQLFFSAILSTARVFQIRILVLDFDRSRRGNREEISNRSLGCLATNLTGNRRFAAKDTPAERLNED